LKTIFLKRQNNYLERLMIKSFNNLAISLNVVHNYFNLQTTFFSDLYLAKFFNISVKSFFSCTKKSEHEATSEMDYRKRHLWSNWFYLSNK